MSVENIVPSSITDPFGITRPQPLPAPPPPRNPPPPSPSPPPPARGSQEQGEAQRRTRRRVERRGLASRLLTPGRAAGVSTPVEPARKRLLGE